MQEANRSIGDVVGEWVADAGGASLRTDRAGTHRLRPACFSDFADSIMDAPICVLRPLVAFWIP